MGRIIVKNAVVREKGLLYYIDGQGNLCSAKMARRKATKKKKSGKSLKTVKKKKK